jgi:hypothetical protein
MPSLRIRPPRYASGGLNEGFANPGTWRNAPYSLDSPLQVNSGIGPKAQKWVGPKSFAAWALCR